MDSLVLIRDQEAASSNLAAPTRKSRNHGHLDGHVVSLLHCNKVICKHFANTKIKPALDGSLLSLSDGLKLYTSKNFSMRRVRPGLPDNITDNSHHNQRYSFCIHPDSKHVV